MASLAQERVPVRDDLRNVWESVASASLPVTLGVEQKRLLMHGVAVAVRTVLASGGPVESKEKSEAQLSMSFEQLLADLSVLAGRDKSMRVEEAKVWIRSFADVEAKVLASRLGRKSKTRNGVVHPDLLLLKAVEAMVQRTRADDACCCPVGSTKPCMLEEKLNGDDVICDEVQIDGLKGVLVEPFEYKQNEVSMAQVGHTGPEDDRVLWADLSIGDLASDELKGDDQSVSDSTNGSVFHGSDQAELSSNSLSKAEHFEIASEASEGSHVAANEWADFAFGEIEIATNKECATVRVFARTFGTSRSGPRYKFAWSPKPRFAGVTKVSQTGVDDAIGDETEDDATPLSLGNDELNLSETAPLDELAIVAKPDAKLMNDVKMFHCTEMDVLRDLRRPGWREADATSSEPRAPSAASQRAGLEWVRRMVQLSVRAEKERDARIAATSFDHNLLVP